MKRLIFTTVSLLALAGCTPNPKTPEQIRQDAANATKSADHVADVATADARAAVQGVQDGLKLGTVNINSASRDDLTALPGVDGSTADAIISGRPYHSPSDLLDRHLVSRSEYDRISGKINAR